MSAGQRYSEERSGVEGDDEQEGAFRHPYALEEFETERSEASGWLVGGGSFYDPRRQLMLICQSEDSGI